MYFNIPNEINDSFNDLKQYYTQCRNQFESYDTWKSNNYDSILSYNPLEKFEKYRSDISNKIDEKLSKTSLNSAINRSIHNKCIEHFNQLYQLRMIYNNVYQVREAIIDELKTQIDSLEYQKSIINGLDLSIIPSKHEDNSSVLTIKKNLAELIEKVAKLEKIDGFIARIFIDFEDYVDQLINQTQQLNDNFVQKLDSAFESWKFPLNKNVNVYDNAMESLSKDDESVFE